MLQTNALLATATVPEHSVHFMQSVSGGTAFIQNGYLCFAAEDWLTIIGYPLQGQAPYSHENFLSAKHEAVKRTQATQCFAMAEQLPPSLQEHIQDKDAFYTLDAHAPIPSPLRRVVRKAAERLRIEVGQSFTPEHHRLWTEFLGRASLASSAPMAPMVRQLFLATPKALAHPQNNLILLNAYTQENRLSACLLLDLAPKDFCSYLLGAHSRLHYTPHAADALFAQMLHLSQQEGKKYIHLGLGVHEGIARFKRKWGGVPSLSYQLASWQEQASSPLGADVQHLFTTLVKGPSHAQETLNFKHQDITAFMGKSKRQILASLPEQRPYAMLWRVQKEDKISWIGGSAHFFCYSFEQAFRHLFAQVDTVLFEGPLDNEALRVVEAEGKRLTPEQQPLIELLREEDIQLLERTVRGPEGWWAKLLNMQAHRHVDVRWYLTHTRPWTALFTLWTSFLERKGWQQSVDLEAWHLAHHMGKQVVAMESLEEQLASLNSVPPDRVVRYFQNCKQWESMIAKNVRAYLRGDLLKLMGTSAEFPTRTHTIINERDERFRRRMRPFLEQGRAAVFVGTAHMLNLRTMLVEDGFTLTQEQPTLAHKIRAWLQP